MKRTLLSIFLVIIMMMTFLMVSVLADDLSAEPQEEAQLDNIAVDDSEIPLASGIDRDMVLSPWAFIISIAGVLILGSVCATLMTKKRKR